MTGQAAAQVPTDAQATSEDDWAMRTVPRLGGPPLRFKGRCLITHADGSLFVTLWARRKGDLVLAYSYLSEGLIWPDAVVLEDLSDATDYLEEVCAILTAPVEQPVTALTLGALVSRFDHTQRFAHLVGQALADWEAQRDAIAPVPQD